MKQWLYLEDGMSNLAESFLQGWSEQQPCGGILALVSEKSQATIPSLQTLSREYQVGIVGAVFPELIVLNDFKDSGVLLLWMSEMPNYCLCEAESAADGETPYPVEAITQLIDESADSTSLKKTLFLIFDGVMPNIATLLDEIYAEIGNEVFYCGVNAGSETFEPTPCLFDQDRIEQNGVLALLGGNHLTSYLKHGYQQPSNTFIANAAEGNCIKQINFQPAFQVYQQLIKDHFDITLTQENFYTYASHFPFGIKLAEGEALVRIPVRLEDDGSIRCAGEVSENSLLMLMEGVQPGESSVPDAIFEYSTQFSDGLDLLFYCAGRRIHLGTSAEIELKNLEKSFPPNSMVGALSLGEIGSIKQSRYPLFHNAAIVAVTGIL